MTELSPTISVVMSVYNNAAFLREAVESILHQTFTDFEFLIMDDGSTDRSLSILQAYAAEDARVVVFSRENRGLTRTLNELMGQARGEFVARMDADDVALPERFARQVEFLRQHPNVVCVGTGQEWIDEDGDRLKQWCPSADNGELQRFMLSGQNHLCHPSALMRRDAVIAVGGYDETLRSAQDLDLWLKLGEVGELSNLPEVLLKYRVHTQSVSERQVKQQQENARLACERAWQRRGIAGRYEVDESWRHEFLVQCGWVMFNKGQRQKAIAYGKRAVKALPVHPEGWRLLLCALLKPLPSPSSPSSRSFPSPPPTVSVLMPVYNAQPYLAAAVESILNQTFTDFEFLILDDGSTDRSLQILQRYAAQDARIRLLSRPNRGFVATLNELLTHAQGELIARMDADDIALPDRLTRQVNFLQQHPEVVCVGGSYEFIDEAGRVLLRHHVAEDNDAIQAQALSGKTPINHPSAMMRRSALLQIGGYDASLYPAEDLDLWLRLGEVGQLANLPDTVLQYRQHTHSISEQKQLEQLQKKRDACEQAWQRRGITGTFEESQPWRPVDRPSRHQFLLRYGWQFFNGGQRYAAIVYGLRSIRALPTAIEGWKLLACALIKPLPQPHSL